MSTVLRAPRGGVCSSSGRTASMPSTPSPAAPSPRVVALSAPRLHLPARASLRCFASVPASERPGEVSDRAEYGCFGILAGGGRGREGRSGDCCFCRRRFIKKNEEGCCSLSPSSAAVWSCSPLSLELVFLTDRAPASSMSLVEKAEESHGREAQRVDAGDGEINQTHGKARHLLSQFSLSGFVVRRANLSLSLSRALPRPLPPRLLVPPARGLLHVSSLPSSSVFELETRRQRRAGALDAASGGKISRRKKPPVGGFFSLPDLPLSLAHTPPPPPLVSKKKKKHHRQPPPPPPHTTHRNDPASTESSTTTTTSSRGPR